MSGRKFSLIPRTERLIKVAKVALWWGLTPLPLYDKQPKITGWPAVSYQQAMEIITNWFSSQPPEIQETSNIGVLTGKVDSPVNVVVVDIDKKSGGLERWSKWLAAFGPIPETFTVRTGSGGMHIYFLYTEKIADIIKIVSTTYGIDFQTTGGQVVFPGSINKEGFQYEVLSGYYRDGQSELHPVLAEMPDWLGQQIRLLRENRAL